MSRSKGPGCRRKAWSSCARRLKRSVWLRHCSSSSRTRTWAKMHDKPQDPPKLPDPNCAVSTQPHTRLQITSAQPLGLGTNPQPGCPTAPNSVLLRVKTGSCGPASLPALPLAARPRAPGSGTSCLWLLSRPKGVALPPSPPQYHFRSFLSSVACHPATVSDPNPWPQRSPQRDPTREPGTSL